MPFKRRARRCEAASRRAPRELGLALGEADAIRLTVLESLVSWTWTTAGVLSELQDTLPIAGVLGEHQVDRALVDNVLSELRHAGLAACDASGDPGDEERELQLVGDQRWSITPDGAAELQRLRARWRAT